MTSFAPQWTSPELLGALDTHRVSTKYVLACRRVKLKSDLVFNLISSREAGQAAMVRVREDATGVLRLDKGRRLSRLVSPNPWTTVIGSSFLRDGGLQSAPLELSLESSPSLRETFASLCGDQAASTSCSTSMPSSGLIPFADARQLSSVWSMICVVKWLHPSA